MARGLCPSAGPCRDTDRGRDRTGRTGMPPALMFPVCSTDRAPVISPYFCSHTASLLRPLSLNWSFSLNGYYVSLQLAMCLISPTRSCLSGGRAGLPYCKGRAQRGFIPDLGETSPAVAVTAVTCCGVELREGRCGLGTGYCIPAYPVWSLADYCSCAESTQSRARAKRGFVRYQIRVLM